MNFICLFCDERCFMPWWDQELWECKKCKVSYNEHRTGLKISLLTEIRDTKYVLAISYHLGKTELFQFIDNHNTIYDDKYIPITKMSYAMEGVNPSNVNQKVRTILTFL